MNNLGGSFLKEIGLIYITGKGILIGKLEYYCLR